MSLSQPVTTDRNQSELHCNSAHFMPQPLSEPVLNLSPPPANRRRLQRHPVPERTQSALDGSKRLKPLKLKLVDPTHKGMQPSLFTGEIGSDKSLPFKYDIDFYCKGPARPGRGPDGALGLKQTYDGCSGVIREPQGLKRRRKQLRKPLPPPLPSVFFPNGVTAPQSVSGPIREPQGLKQVHQALWEPMPPLVQSEFCKSAEPLRLQEHFYTPCQPLFPSVFFTAFATAANSRVDEPCIFAFFASEVTEH